MLRELSCEETGFVSGGYSIPPGPGGDEDPTGMPKGPDPLLLRIGAWGCLPDGDVTREEAMEKTLKVLIPGSSLTEWVAVEGIMLLYKGLINATSLETKAAINAKIDAIFNDLAKKVFGTNPTPSSVETLREYFYSAPGLNYRSQGPG